MSVFTCGCGRKTTEPFVIGNVRYCVICAEDIRPDIVDSRERRNKSRYGTRLGHSPGFDGPSFDLDRLLKG